MTWSLRREGKSPIIEEQYRYCELDLYGIDYLALHSGVLNDEKNVRDHIGGNC